MGYRCVDSSYNEMFKDHVYGWKYFEVEGHKRLIMANYYTYPWKQGQVQQCDTSKTDNWAASYIYDWKNEDFNIGEGCCDSLMTDSALMWEFYTQSGQSYLAVAEQGLANQSHVSIYQWRDGKFNKMNQPNVNGLRPQFIEAFTIDNQTYLLFSFGAENQDAYLYRVASDGQLILHQGRIVTPNHILTSEGLSANSKVFTIGNEHYLAFGFVGNPIGASWIYRFEYISELQTSLFAPYQRLPDAVKAAQSWTSFSVNNKPFLVAQLQNKNIIAYQWNVALQQMETQFFYPFWSTQDYIASLTNFSVDQTPYIAVAIQQDKNNNTRTQSPILRWQAVSQIK